MTKLNRYEKITGYIAKWMVLQIAARINSIAVLSLALEISRLYNERKMTTHDKN